jgi:hypothetical protein
LPDRSLHLCITHDGVPQWHHRPSPERLETLINEAAELSPDACVEYVLGRLDQAVAEYDKSVLSEMAEAIDG